MTSPSIRDNHQCGNVGDFLKEIVKTNSSVSIVSAYFTIYAYYHLKPELDGIGRLRFLFGEPTFIKSIDPSKKNHRSFKIEDDQLIIPLEQRLTQKSIASACSCWIKEKADIRSMVKPNFLHGKMYHVIQENLWLHKPDLALKRIAERVRAGGHDVPPEVVKRRFARSMHNFLHLYRPLLDSWMLFDNSADVPRLIADEESGNLTVIDDKLFSLIERISR